MPSSTAERDAHRPWPRPAAPWAMRMRWSELLFAHWPIDAGQVQARLPAGLNVDRFDGAAWLGVVPFVMSGVRARWLPPLPTAGRFCELNLRTYVVGGGKPGVWFFSLDAESSLAVAAARRWFHLPYFKARMSCTAHAERIEYASARTARGAPTAELRASYAGLSEPRVARPGTLEHWLIERYCLYASDGTRVWRSDIDHPPWRLRDARAAFALNTLARASGFELPAREPLLHLAETQDVVAWAPERVV